MTATEESVSFWGLEISFIHETLPLHFVCGKNLFLFIVNFVLVLLKITSYCNCNFNKPHNFFHIQQFVIKVVTRAEYWHILMMHFYLYRIIILSDNYCSLLSAVCLGDQWTGLYYGPTSRPLTAVRYNSDAIKLLCQLITNFL